MRAAASPRNCWSAARPTPPLTAHWRGLKGIFEHDPTLLLTMRAHFGKQDYAAARATLERLMEHNPEFKSVDAQLLYARTLEAENSLDEAERVYAALAPGFPGAEARLRYDRLEGGAATGGKPSSAICWMAPNSGLPIIAGRRQSGWSARDGN